MYKKSICVCVIMILCFIGCKREFDEQVVKDRRMVQERNRDIDTNLGRIQEAKELYWRVDAELERLNKKTLIDYTLDNAIANLYQAQAMLLTHIHISEE